MLGTHWECQHWVWCCDPLMERKNISHGNCDAIDKKIWKATRRLFVKKFACEVWQSQRRLGYTSARLAPRVSVSIAARDWCQWRWCLNVVWAVISWHSSHSNCSFEIQNTLHDITTDTSLIKWTPEKREALVHIKWLVTKMITARIREQNYSFEDWSLPPWKAKCISI